MKLIFIIIAILQLSFLGCATSSKQVLVPTAEESPSTLPSATPVSDVNAGGEIKFNPVEYYTTPQERNIIKSAEKKLNEVKSSKCFHDFIAQRKMIQTQNKTSLQVADHIASLSGSVDVVMYYRRFTSAVAYRTPPELKINLNRKYFYAELPLCEWVSTLGHEAIGHALGEYEHSYEWEPSRIYSVPYSINEAIDACCK